MYINKPAYALDGATYNISGENYMFNVRYKC